MHTDPADAAGVVAKVCAIDASLESFVPLYLHLLALPAERYPLPRHLQGEHLQAALVDALAAFFTALSQRTTVVVLFEDWHWADSASRAALARIREIVPIARLLFIVTMRPDGRGAGCVSSGRLETCARTIGRCCRRRHHRGGTGRGPCL